MSATLRVVLSMCHDGSGRAQRGEETKHHQHGDCTSAPSPAERRRGRIEVRPLRMAPLSDEQRGWEPTDECGANSAPER